MSQQSRVALPGSDKLPLGDAEQVGQVHPEERLEVTVRLRSRAEEALSARVAQIDAEPHDARQYLSREAFAREFGADRAQVERVERFARAHGLAVVNSSLARRSVVLSATASELSAAFDVQLTDYAHPHGGSFRGREGPIYVPPELADVVQGVFGLDNRRAATAHFRRQSDLQDIAILASAPRAAYSPPRIGELYDFPTGLDGTGQTVAIIELGGGYRTSDLTTYFGALGLPTPSVTAVSVDHGQNVPSGPSGPDGEVMLDIEVIGAIAPGASIVVYFAPNTDQGFIDAVTTAVHDTVHQPSIVSISWGSPEALWTQAALQAMDEAFQAAGAMGVSVYCAAGDNGANDFPTGPGHQPGNHVDFPASSPHVVGCGGTTIDVAGNTITSERVWNDPGDGATGGGYSAVYARPTWQAANPGQSMRGVPDVAGDASPLTGYAVRVDGQDTVIGGTSAVSPLWSGLTALLNQRLGKPLGFPNPLLYGLPASSGAFVDITTGDNTGYSAATGWDPCTGLGRPDGARLASALAGSA